MSMSIAKIHWKTCWYLVPKQIPAPKLLGSICNPADIDAVVKLDAMTGLDFIDKAVKTGASGIENKKKKHAKPIIVDAIFNFLNPVGARFTDGSYGAMQIYQDIETAVAETKTNLESFYNEIQINKFTMKMEGYAMDIKGSFHDIRGQEQQLPYLYLDDDNEYSSAYAKNLWRSGVEGIVFDSFANQSECVALFDPARISNFRLEKQFNFTWNGRKFTGR